MTNDDLLKLLILLAQFAEKQPSASLGTIAGAYQVAQWELINRGMEATEIWKVVSQAASSDKAAQ